MGSDMASGVKVDEVVKLKYDDIKKKKSYRYLVFYIKDEKVIQVEKVGDRNADYQEFLQDQGGPEAPCSSLRGTPPAAQGHQGRVWWADRHHLRHLQQAQAGILRG